MLYHKQVYYPTRLMNVMLFIVVLLSSTAGGLASVTYNPSPIKANGQSCQSDVPFEEAFLEIENIIEMSIELDDERPSPDPAPSLALNSTVEMLSNQVAEILQGVSNTSQALELAMNEIQKIRQEIVTLAGFNNTLQALNETLMQLGQEIIDLRQEIDQPPGNSPQMGLGLSQQQPAESCKAIFENTPTLPSNFYWIGTSNETAVQLYCDMDRECCNTTSGGWTRTVFLNMSNSEDQCPPAWNEIAAPRSCGRTSMFTRCDSATFSSHAINYSQVCGRVVAYQFCNTDAFKTFNFDQNFTIDDVYVEGVSITRGSPRQHVWTFAAARHENWSGTGQVICPCTNSNNQAVFLVPPYVGSDYFCETGTPTAPPDSLACDLVTGAGFYTDDPLWDGAGCGGTSTCCDFNTPPWFCKQLPETTDDIEVRICTASRDREVPVQLLEIYIK